MGQAIAWFTQQGWTVAVPITDSQDYDLVVDDGKKLSRVEVKTTTFKLQATKRNPRPTYTLNLRVFGGNRSGCGKTRKLGSHVDYVFAATASGTRYLIPASVVRGRGSINLGASYAAFKLGDGPVGGL